MKCHFDVTRVVVHAILLACGCATAATASVINRRRCSALKGTWEGTLPIYREEAKGSAARDEVTLRLTFGGEQPRLFLVERGTWMEAKPGAFVAQCLGPSAVVQAIDPREGKADGSTTVGDYLEGMCNCGNTGSCEMLATMLERQVTAPASLARSRFGKRRAASVSNHLALALSEDAKPLTQFRQPR